MSCTKTRYNKIVLCAGSMTDCIEIVKRVSGTTEPGEAIQATPTFELVAAMPGLAEDVAGVARFDGINIEDGKTHVVYISFDPEIYQLDRNVLFIRIDSDYQERYFKMLKIKNYGEQNQYIEIDLKETGFTDLEASKG